MKSLIKIIYLSIFIFSALSTHASEEKGTTDASYDPITAFIDYASSESATNYDNFVSFLRQKTDEDPRYEPLYKIAGEDAIFYNGLRLKYLPDNSEFFDSEREEFLFHGTRSTLEVLAEKRLKSHIAKCGREAVFFGRDFSSASSYATDSSSNIHRTFKKKVRSVMVFKKAHGSTFQSSNSGMFGSVKEYLLRENYYSTEHLTSIIFSTIKDFRSFSIFYDKLSISEQKRFAGVQFYASDLLPLHLKRHQQNLSAVLAENREYFEGDLDFLLQPFQYAHLEPQKGADEAFNRAIAILAESDISPRLLSQLVENFYTLLHIASSDGIKLLTQEAMRLLSANEILALMKNATHENFMRHPEQIGVFAELISKCPQHIQRPLLTSLEYEGLARKLFQSALAEIECSESINLIESKLKQKLKKLFNWEMTLIRRHFEKESGTLENLELSHNIKITSGGVELSKETYSLDEDAYQVVSRQYPKLKEHLRNEDGKHFFFKLKELLLEIYESQEEYYDEQCSNLADAVIELKSLIVDLSLS